jgi:hypothetical protein
MKDEYSAKTKLRFSTKTYFRKEPDVLPSVSLISTHVQWLR